MERKDIVNDGLGEILFEKIVRTNLDCNYHNFFGLYLTEVRENEAIMEVKVQEKHINPRDISHGAVAYALLDTAMGMAIRTINRNVVTLQSSMNHIAISRLGDILVAKAKVIDSGKKIIIAESVAYNQNGDKIAISRGTFYDKGIFCEEIQ